MLSHDSKFKSTRVSRDQFCHLYLPPALGFSHESACPTETPCAFISSKFAYLPPCAGVEASSVHGLPLAGFHVHVLGDFPFGTYRASFFFFFNGHSGSSQFFSAVFLISHLTQRFPPFFTSWHTHGGECPQRAPAPPTPHHCTPRSQMKGSLS